MKKKQIGKALFSNVFGENTEIKLIDFFVGFKDFDFTLTQLENGIGISRASIRPKLKEMVERGVVEISRQDDKSTYYRINKADEKYKILQKLQKAIEKEVIGEETMMRGEYAKHTTHDGK